MKFLRRLLESRPMLDRVTGQSIITNAPGANDHIQDTRGSDYIFIYSAKESPVLQNAAVVK